MADNPLESFSSRLPTYVKNVNESNSEPSRAFYFLELVRAVFAGVVADEPTRLLPELEHRVEARAGAVLVRGSIDALLGNLVIEFKVALDDARLSQARNQLCKYTSALWAIDGQRTSYMLMATDGLRFEVYKPTATASATLPEPGEISLIKLNTVDLGEAPAKDSFLWLDRYLLWRERIVPTTDQMSQDFGVDSPTYEQVMGLLREAWDEAGPEKSAPFDEWSKYLAIVHGSAVHDENLFLRHTYLATLAKLMAYSYYSSSAIPSREELQKVLSGESFREFGIDNFLEEDFFSWIAKGISHKGTDSAWKLLLTLERYDLSKLSEDVFKGLYQGLVGERARHELGEYYTPDWLAEWIVNKVLLDPTEKVLDPACGSGTFLVVSIRRKQSSLAGSESDKLEKVLSSVVGFDVHPLAVLIAKSNFLMALGRLIDFKAGPIHLPIYLANSLTFSEPISDIEHGVTVFRYPIGSGESLVIPNEVVEGGIVDACVQSLTACAQSLASQGSPRDLESFARMVISDLGQEGRISPAGLAALWDSCKTLAGRMKTRTNGIFSFIVKNIYRPTSIGRFDVVVGNPPWLSYRFIKLPEYQARIKKMIVDDYRLLPGGAAELLTQMEIATLFLARSAETYLTKDGRIGFVMPRSIFSGNQHEAFRQGAFFPRMSFLEVADLSGVSPLFKVPSSVVMLRKGGVPGPPKWAWVMRGKIPGQNASWSKVEERITNHKIKLDRMEIQLLHNGSNTAWAYQRELPCGGLDPRAGPSAYMDRVANGAALYPRQFWWVDIDVHPKLGLNPRSPHVRTSKRAIEMAQDDYEGLAIDGSVESEYLYLGLLGADMLPFAHLPARPIFVPAVKTASGYTVLTRVRLSETGSREASRWMGVVENEWERRRKAKADQVNIYDYLDWGGKLSNHESRGRYFVAYNTSGSFIAAAAIDSRSVLKQRVNGHDFQFSGLLFDITTVYLPCKSADESAYLAAVLNSDALSRYIAPFQATGLWGARHIHHKPFEIGIPEFTATERTHRELCDLSVRCARSARVVVDEFVEARRGEVGVLSPQAVGQLRTTIRESASAEFKELDVLACNLLSEFPAR